PGPRDEDRPVSDAPLNLAARGRAIFDRMRQPDAPSEESPPEEHADPPDSDPVETPDVVAEDPAGEGSDEEVELVPEVTSLTEVAAAIEAAPKLGATEDAGDGPAPAPDPN